MLEITPDVLLKAYRIGVFPMGERRDDPKLHWLDPRLRAVLPLDGFHLSTRLARTVRSERFTISADTSFVEVMRACAEPRPGHPESWINDPIIDLYSELHDRGHAHRTAAAAMPIMRRAWANGATACNARSPTQASPWPATNASIQPAQLDEAHGHNRWDTQAQLKNLSRRPKHT